MDIEEDSDIPLIMGCPFMLKAKCVVDMGNDNLEMSVEDQKLTFNLFEAIKHPSNNKTCFKDINECYWLSNQGGGKRSQGLPEGLQGNMLLKR